MIMWNSIVKNDNVEQYRYIVKNDNVEQFCEEW